MATAFDNCRGRVAWPGGLERVGVLLSLLLLVLLPRTHFEVHCI